MTAPARRGAAGFTLLELLAALAVLGLVIAGLAGGLQFGQRAAGIQARTIDAVTDVDSAERLLRRLVAGMDPGSVADPPHVEGGPSALAFTTALREGPASAALVDVGLGVDAGGRLVLRWTPALHATRFGPPPPPETAVLADGLAGVDFAYWGKGPGGAGQWRPEWQDEGIPPLIRIRLRFSAASRRTWPDIIAGTERLRPPH